MENNDEDYSHAWWRHQMETFSALLVICAVNSPVTGEIHTHKDLGPVLLTLLRHVARILANGRAAFFESCDAIGWNSCDVSQKR